jgi:hypothetical protein
MGSGAHAGVRAQATGAFEKRPAGLPLAGDRPRAMTQTSKRKVLRDSELRQGRASIRTPRQGSYGTAKRSGLPPRLPLSRAPPINQIGE